MKLTEWYLMCYTKLISTSRYYSIFNRFTKTHFRFYQSWREKYEASRLFTIVCSTIDKKIVYVDECGSRTESYRRNGYVPNGDSVLVLISGTRTRTTTLVAARMDSTFSAPGLFDGSCDAACFNAWLETYLCPRLSVLDVVVLDNAKIHKTNQTRELIEASGAEVLFLPPFT